MTFISRFSVSFGISLVVLALNSCASRTDVPPPPAPPTKAMATVLNALASLEPKPIENLSPLEARRQPNATDAVHQVLQDQGIVAPPRLPPVGRVESKFVTGWNGYALPVRIYTPAGTGPFPIVVYFHGGGWVLANLDTYDASCRALSSLTKAVVVSVDYRQAPEFKFPFAHEDSYAAYQYVATHAGEFGGAPDNIAVVGESAGGNLALAVTLIAKERGGKVPLHQVLIYPVANYAFDTESYQQYADAKPLNAAMMHWFFGNYLRSPADGQNPYVSPLRANDNLLKRLPPTSIVTAEIDPLRSEGAELAKRLAKLGNTVDIENYDGVTHEFFGMSAVVSEAGSAEKFVAKQLSSSFK